MQCPSPCGAVRCVQNGIRWVRDAGRVCVASAGGRGGEGVEQVKSGVQDLSKSDENNRNGGENERC